MTTTYLYEGLNLLGETAGATTANYVFGPGIDEPLASYRAGQLSYFASDGLGTIGETNDTAGNATLSTTFDAWGVTRAETGSRTQPFTYTGREVGEAGLLFYRARYYQPAVGRFVAEDPIPSSAITPYHYVASDPVSLGDPLGPNAIVLPSQPTPVPGTRTITCDGHGRVVPVIFPTNTDSDRCLTPCLFGHELIHAEDAEASHPGLCKGKRAGLQVAFGSAAERNQSEGRAYRVQIECLEFQKSQDPNDSRCCNKPIDTALRDLRDRAKKYE